jgi:hypothetical protein
MADRDREEQRYLELTRELLPARAADQRWVLRLDHCFMRVVLDHVFGGCWYDHLDRKAGPAYRQLTDAQLAAAVALAERIAAEGEPLLRRLNAQSLAWRGKPGPSSGS